MESLQALFDNKEVKWPQVLDRTHTSENTYRLNFYIPKELIYFDGHFENNPILPGIAQTTLGSALWQRSVAFQGAF